MNMIKVLTVLAVWLSAVSLYAVETFEEKSNSTANDIKRDANKNINLMEEATCTGTDEECLKKKANNRLNEIKEKAKDKYSEVKNKAD